MTDNFERALEERLLARSQVSPREVEALRLFARTIPAKRSFWARPALAWGVSAAALLLVAAVALPPLIGRMPGFGSASPTPTATPTPVPTPTPVTPAPASHVPPSPEPSVGLGPIRLAVGSGSVVDVSISDPAGVLTGAVAEQAEATMSVRWFLSIVENLDTDPNAIRVTWVGFPKDEGVRLDVRRTQAGKLLLHFTQEGPLPDTDGVGEDRVMILYLAQPIDASNVEVSFDYPA